MSQGMIRVFKVKGDCKPAQEARIVPYSIHCTENADLHYRFEVASKDGGQDIVRGVIPASLVKKGYAKTDGISIERYHYLSQEGLITALSKR